MAFLNEKDSKAVRERLHKASEPSHSLLFSPRSSNASTAVRLASWPRKSPHCPKAKITTVVYDLVKDRAKAESMGIDKNSRFLPFWA